MFQKIFLKGAFGANLKHNDMFYITCSEIPCVVQMRGALRSDSSISTGFATSLWACMLVTWFGMLRKSNTTVGSASLADTGSVTQVWDVHADTAAWRLRVAVRQTSQ